MMTLIRGAGGRTVNRPEPTLAPPSDPIADALANHAAIYGPGGCLDQCRCGVIPIWRRGQYDDAEQWHAAHQARALRTAGLVP